MVVHDEVVRPAELPGFVARAGDQIVGLVTYRIADGDCEVISLDSLREGFGVGSALLGAVEEAARAAGCRRLWLVTTNDNVAALGFYGRRGFRMTGIDRGAVDRARRLKPAIPEVAANGIPIRDEITLARPLAPDDAAEARENAR
jgi:GNAT superfamily N-acetyltransferase